MRGVGDSLEIRLAKKKKTSSGGKSDPSTDFGCTSGVDRECVVERRGPSMKERDK
jgi:hypothetical protein